MMKPDYKSIAKALTQEGRALLKLVGKQASLPVVDRWLCEATQIISWAEEDRVTGKPLSALRKVKGEMEVHRLLIAFPRAHAEGAASV